MTPLPYWIGPRKTKRSRCSNRIVSVSPNMDMVKAQSVLQICYKKQMNIQLPVAIPLNKQRMLDDLERIRRDHPALMACCSVITFGKEKLILTVSKYETSMAEMKALAKAYPDAKWKPKSGDYNDIDWHGEIHGVKVALIGAQAMELKKLPDFVDLS